VTEPSEAQIAELVERLTLDDKIRLLTGRDSWSLHALPQIGLRSIVVSDGPVGVRGASWDERSPSANFPSPTALAASWDADTVRAVGEALGAEARRKDVDVLLAPTINLHRTPYGGRHFEAFSEDPLLTAELASEYVRGVQSQGVGATVKHYVANDSETDRFTVDARVDERTLRELYLLAFESPVRDAHAWLVMSAYNSINGVTASENELLASPLNDEWGFDGVVISDWTAVRSIESARHEQDLAMPGPLGAWGDALLLAVQRGEVPEWAIDRKVSRILRLAARVGALAGYDTARTAEPAAPHAIARAASVAGTVLLTNNGILPLDTPRSIAVIGEGAVDARTQGGGSATVIPPHVVAPLDGLRRRWPDADIAWSRGAAVQTRPSDLAPGSFVSPSGEPGMRVRYLADDGSVLSEELRTASGIVSFDGLSLASRSAVIEMTLRYRPPAGPVAPLAISGLCDYEVTADGTLVASGAIRTSPGDDPATAVLTPPYELVEVPVEGDDVALQVTFRPAAGGIPDALSLRIGVPPEPADPEELIREAAALAAEREFAIVLVSTSPEVESEGFDRDTLRLPGHQDALVRAVAQANPNTVVVVNAGAPVLLPWRDDVAAALAVWFPGQEFGDALADVLSGDAEPGGRLPVTWPGTEEDVPVREVTPRDGRLEYREGIHIGYRAWLRSGSTPAYPFGFGLGYTTSEVTALELDTELRMEGELTATVTVRNTGARPGKVVAQLYADRADSLVERPARWLVGFASAELDPGEEKTLPLRLSWRRFAHWEGRWALEAGEFRVTAALSSEAAGPSARVVVR